MEEILKVLSVGGDLGIWVLIGVLWKFSDRLTRMEITMQNHVKNDADAHRQFEKRFDRLEVVHK